MQPRDFPRPVGVLTTLVACLILTGCGSGSGKDKVPGTPQPTTTGILFDHPVQGVSWESSGGQGGLTNADGEFEFRREELITFWIGDIGLGVAEGTSFITPVETTGSRVPTDQAATNQLVFLQSIDADEDPTNGIRVTAATRDAAIGRTLDFDSPNFSEEVEEVVAAIAPGNAVVSESTALLNFYLAYNDVGCTDSLNFDFPGFPVCGNGITYDLQFSDEFDKGDRPNEENWNYDLGYGDEGWGNNEWQLYTDSPENVRVEDDNLVIQARCPVEPCGVRDGTITSGRITTQDKFEFRYGTVQARIKPPVGKAAWPAFWSLGAVFPETPWPRAGEIDFMEMHNAFSDERTTHFTMHWCDETIQAPAECTFPDGWVFDTANRSFPFSLGDDYQIFEADWDEDRIVGKINGIKYFERTIDPETMEEFRREFFMLLNVAMGGTLGSDNQPPTGEETWPQTMLVDYVRVWERQGGEEPVEDTLIDFEGPVDSYDFGPTGGFGGGASSVIVNPVSEGINTSAQVVRMQKFDAEDFGGSTLTLDPPLVIPAGGIVRMKVWSPRIVDVLLKLEGAVEAEVTVTHGGTGWENLSFDFGSYTGTVEGLTFIFDNGINGDAGNDPENWTFYYDDILLPTGTDGGQPPAGGLVEDFENAPESYDFGPDGGFGGGASSVIANPVPETINTSAQVARMQKFAAEPFGGSTLALATPLDVPSGSDFTMKVWSPRPVEVLFKLEGGPDVEDTATHSGSGWEELTFDMGSVSGGFTGITFIFDNGIVGDAENDPDNWTFYYDDIVLVVDDSGPPPGGGPELVTDFENAPESYDFGPDAGFGGGASVVLDNPVSETINTSPQVARMQKFAAEPFGGSTLALPTPLQVPSGSTFTMKVWSSRPVPVTFKLEGGPDAEGVTNHSGSGWEDLTFDVGGVAGTFTGITFIFDNGIVGDAGGDPDNWTFYYDDIFLVPDDGGPPPETPEGLVTDFEDDPESYDFGPDAGFGGGASVVIANPVSETINTSPQVARMQKFAAEPFGGSTLALSTPIEAPAGSNYTMKVWSPRAVDVTFKLEGGPDAEAVATHGGSGWEDLTFDVGGVAGTFTGITFIFDNGIVGDAGNDPDNWTFYYDDIFVVTDDGGVEPPPIDETLQDFEGDPSSYTFSDFAGGAAAVVANPSMSGINTSAQAVQMQKFAGEPFAGSTLVLDAPVPLTEGRSYQMKVLSQREVVVTLKLEPLEQENTATHTGGNEWQELCFDFDGVAGDVTGYTLIFDNGTVGDAENDPDNWTFYYDDIVQTESCDDGTEPPGEGITDIVVDFEPEGTGQTYAWTVFENGDNPPVEFLANPAPDATNDSNTAARFIARQAGQPFAGVNTMDLPTFTLDETNSTVKIMVYKSVISDVGIKFETADLASTGEIKVANTRINEWEELTFDFSGKIGEPSSTDIAGFVIFPDFDARAQDNEVWFDNITFSGVDDGGVGPGGLSIDFEDDGGPYTFGDFGGGVASVTDNPDATGINTSAKTAQMQKFAGEVFGGSTLTLDGPVDFGAGEAFLMKVRAQRVVPVLFKFEGLNQERPSSHGGSGTWESLCFDFTGTTTGPDATAITFIFDNGVAGDAATDPTNWVFEFDDIEQVASCPSNDALITDFEGDPASYDFGADGGFGGGAASVIANPQVDGNNGSAQVGEMLKFAGEVFGGATLALTTPVDVPPKSVFTMNVWAQREVPVLFKLEGGPVGEVQVTHGGTGWETLNFDFGDISGNGVTGITLIFDLGVVGDAAGDPGNWTFYFDDIAIGGGG